MKLIKNLNNYEISLCILSRLLNKLLVDSSERMFIKEAVHQRNLRCTLLSIMLGHSWLKVWLHSYKMLFYIGHGNSLVSVRSKNMNQNFSIETPILGPSKRNF